MKSKLNGQTGVLGVKRGESGINRVGQNKTEGREREMGREI